MKPYYDHKGITIYHGDCLEIMPGLKSVDSILTDPPYAVPTQVASGRTITRDIGDFSIVECAFRQYVKMWKKLLGETGRIFVFCDSSSYPVIFRAAYGKFNLAALVWDKGRIGMGREFRKRHEFIIHGWGTKTLVKSSKGVGYSDIIQCPPVPISKRHHPAEKPVKLIMELLRVCDNIILDPFMGSGTTLVAAKKSGRNAIGIGINEEDCEIAARRLQQEVLFGIK